MERKVCADHPPAPPQKKMGCSALPVELGMMGGGPQNWQQAGVAPLPPQNSAASPPCRALVLGLALLSPLPQV